MIFLPLNNKQFYYINDKKRETLHENIRDYEKNQEDEYF
jgi:hypothetical protein